MRNGEGKRGGKDFSPKWGSGLLTLIRKFSNLDKYQLQRKGSWKRGDDDHDCEEQAEPLISTFSSGIQKWQGGSKVGVSKFSASSRTSYYNPVVVVPILTALWVCLYWGSLVGGDLRTVVHQLGRIATCFFLGMACFLAAIYIAMFDASIPGPRVRAILVGFIITTWQLMFLYDHGGSLQHHGAYNMLMFVVFVVPAVVVGMVEYCAWRIIGTRKLVLVHLPFFLVGAIGIIVSLHNASALWDQGFRGERMLPLIKDDTSVCTPVNRGLPWVDIYPEGSQNFWASTFTCGGDSELEIAKVHALGFFINLTTDGVLSISCNAAGEGMKTYTPLPSTVDWAKGDKLVEEDYVGLLERPFNKNVMDKVREAGEIPYEVGKGPTILQLADGIEAVIVRCGDAERLVTQVRPTLNALNRTKAPQGNGLSDAMGAETSEHAKKLDVVFIFIDALSRRGFHRRLRRTVAALEEADAKGLTRLYQFFRYSIVEFCTAPNSRAMFQGIVEPVDSKTEVAPPVWEDYATSGWVTMYTADTCQDLAAAYMNNQSSTYNQPSFDHELLSPFCHSDFFAEDANPFGNFKGPYSITARCLKGEQVHEHELRYLKSFEAAYADRAKFSIAWFLEGHEGTTEVLRNLDDGLADYLNSLATRENWNHTAVVIAADHGLHMGLNFGVSQNGAVEHKNPFMAIMLPPWFADQDSRHDTMTVNQQRMVTGLDVYQTLQGIRRAGLTPKERASWADIASSRWVTANGTDLLHNEVAEERTCNDAAIPEEWCQCL